MGKYFKKLIGQRVYLSPFSGSDEEIELLTKWTNDFRVTDGLGMSHILQSFNSEKAWIDNAMNVREDRREFAIIDLETDRIIGSCNLFNIRPVERAAEIGILIGEEEMRGKGIGVEALKLLCDYGFNYLGLHNIRLGYSDNNEQARKAYTKAGFQEVGRTRETNYINGKFIDNITADILENEFREKFGDVIQNKNL